VTDILKAIKRLRPSEPVGLYALPVCVITGCSITFTALINYIFSLSPSWEHFPTHWKKKTLCASFFLKKGSSSSVSRYRLLSVLNSFFNVFEFVVHNHMLHHFTHKLNPSQHGFSKAKSKTNLVTYLDFISPLVSSQLQIDSVLTLAAHLTLSGILFYFQLHEHWLSDSYMNWFRSYLTNRIIFYTHFTHFFVTFRSSFGGLTRMCFKSFAF
jgi:hypothetical protein